MNEKKNHESNVSKELDQQDFAEDNSLRSRMDSLNVSFEPDETVKSVEQGKPDEKAKSVASPQSVTSFDVYMAENTRGGVSTGSLAHGQKDGSPMGEGRGEKSINSMPKLGMADNHNIRELGMSGSGNCFEKGSDTGVGAGVHGGDSLANGLDLGPQNLRQSFTETAQGGVGLASACSVGSGGTGGAGSSGGFGGFPGGMCPLWAELKKPWRKRHPIKFWLGILILVLGILPALVFSVAGEVSSKEKVAVVNIEGIILDGKEVIKWIEQVQADARVKGVLVRVNSPGGAVTPSQEIYFALKRLATKKPVAVSMGALAASGGYYVSLPAQRIFATPSTLTGSIGVKMDLTNVEELMGKLGVSSTALASGDLKNAGSPFKALKENERQYFMGIIQDMYEDFLGTVIEHRKLTVKQVEGFADGRALSGRQAKELGLVDQLGDKNDALAYLYKECGIAPSKNSLIEGPVKPQSVLEKITEATVNTLLSRGIGLSGNHDSPIFMYR